MLNRLNILKDGRAMLWLSLGLGLMVMIFVPGVRGENVPEHIQRSTPSAQEFPGEGTGPGSRTDQLVETDKIQGIEKGTDTESHIPQNIQRSTPAGEEFPGSGSGPGSRTDKLADMKDADSINTNPSTAKKHVPSHIQRSTPAGEESPGSGSGPGSRSDQLVD